MAKHLKSMSRVECQEAYGPTEQPTADTSVSGLLLYGQELIQHIGGILEQ